MSCIILPATYFVPNSNSSIVQKFRDDSVDALYQIHQNHVLLIFVLLYVVSIACFNYFGISITRELTAVHRTLIDSTRTICIWLVDIVIYYAINKDFGEPWNTPGSYLQLYGFSLLVLGTLIYNKTIEIPCFVCLDYARASFFKETQLDAIND